MIWRVLVVIGFVAVVGACLAVVAWIDYSQSARSVRRGGRGANSSSMLKSTRRNVRSARGRARRFYR